MQHDMPSYVCTHIMHDVGANAASGHIIHVQPSCKIQKGTIGIISVRHLRMPRFACACGLDAEVVNLTIHREHILRASALGLRSVGRSGEDLHLRGPGGGSMPRLWTRLCNIKGWAGRGNGWTTCYMWLTIGVRYVHFRLRV